MTKLDNLKNLLIIAHDFLKWHFTKNCGIYNNFVNFASYKGTFYNKNISFNAAAAHDENVLQLVINGKPIACDLWQDEQDNYFINLSVNCYNVVNNDTVLLIQNPNNKQNKNYEMLLTSDYLLITLKLQ